MFNHKLLSLSIIKSFELLHSLKSLSHLNNNSSSDINNSRIHNNHNNKSNYLQLKRCNIIDDVSVSVAGVTRSSRCYTDNYS